MIDNHRHKGPSPSSKALRYGLKALVIGELK